MLKNKKKKGTLDFYPIIIKESGVTSFVFFSSIQFRKIIENSIENSIELYIQIPDAKYI